MKKNVLVGVIAVLLVLGIGISFAYFVSGVLVSGKGSDVTLEPGDMLKVEYDAGSGKLVGNKLMPGNSVSKDFSVTITPTATEKEVMYGIFLNLTNNTFVKCDNGNYDELTNVCEKGAKEITYTIKDKDTNQELASGDLTGKSGKIRLLTEEKEVESKTVFNYTITITFEETGKDQNHNQNKGIEGNIEVEFTEKVGSEYILSHYDTILTRNDFSETVEDTTTGTIYKSLDESQYDEDGEVYYFAGAPTDNWVKFGKENGSDIYWRIIRINGDGSIRMIYNGTSTATTGYDTQLSTTNPFNSSYNGSEYAGYMYTEGEQHGNATNSSIKKMIDNWYSSNLASYADKISKEAGFCGDREMASGYTWSSQPSSDIDYAAKERLETNKAPTLKCSNSNDLYTTSSSSKGNKKLANPIGLITADEVVMAGGSSDIENNNYYLYTKTNYWTMSPFYFYASSNGYSSMFYVRSTGPLWPIRVNRAYGVRPVVNLKSDVEITGTGTSDDPFVVV